MRDIKLKPDGYFTFDLEAGRMDYSGGGGRLVAFPAEALLKVLGTGIDQISRTVPYLLGLHLGEECGNRVRESMGDDMDIPVERFLDHLNAVLALHGLGILSIQTWGDILLVEWVLGLGKSGEGDIVDFQEGVLAGAFRTITSQPFEAASVDESGEGARFVLGSGVLVNATRLWMGEGHGLGEIVERLHAGRHIDADTDMG